MNGAAEASAVKSGKTLSSSCCLAFFALGVLALGCVTAAPARLTVSTVDAGPIEPSGVRFATVDVEVKNAAALPLVIDHDAVAAAATERLRLAGSDGGGQTHRPLVPSQLAVETSGARRALVMAVTLTTELPDGVIVATRKRTQRLATSDDVTDRDLSAGCRWQASPASFSAEHSR